MKTQLPARTWMTPLSLFILCSLLVITQTACRKDLSAGNTPTDPQSIVADTIGAKTAAELTQTVPFPKAASPGCDFAPDYGNSVIQPQPAGGSDYIVRPLNNKSVSGVYLAWPGGLVIDRNSGAINVTRSETGAKYAIGFVSSAGADTCISYVTLGGADYTDSVYSAAVSAKIAAPHFDANVSGPSPCAGSKCKFDYNHYAKDQGVYVDNNNGSIDIKNTLQHSLFAAMPIDGMFFYSTIQYKVNNATNNAPQSIQVKLVYYNYRSAIPASLLQTISARADNINNGTLGSLSKSRPPIIVITRYQ